jgi:hypothetical protein
MYFEDSGMLVYYLNLGLKPVLAVTGMPSRVLGLLYRSSLSLKWSKLGNESDQLDKNLEFC